MRGSAVRVRHSAPPFYEAVRSPSSLLFCVRLSSFVFPRSMMVRRAMRREMPSVASRRVFCPLPLPFALRLSPFVLRLSPFALCPSPFALCPSPFKVTTPGRQNQAFGPNDAVRPAFPFAPAFYRIGNQLHSGSAPRLASGPIFCAWGGGLGEIGGGCGWSKWSFGHLVKIDFGQTENATIIIKI